MLARYGGKPGIRDEAALACALAKPQAFFTADSPTLPVLAACYTSAMVELRPFVSGNVCTGFLLALTFLQINGVLFTGREMTTTVKTLALAKGEATESFYARFLSANCRTPSLSALTQNSEQLLTTQ